MKSGKNVLILTLFTFYSFILFGQSAIGIKAGINLANQVGEGMDQTLPSSWPIPRFQSQRDL